MRRFTSVFGPRREKNDSSPPQPSASSPSLPASKKNVRRVDTLNSPVVLSPSSPPHFGRGSDVGQSSASSSGSASLQTPDDIPISLDHAPAKSKSWINSWLSKKPSVTKVKHTETQDSNREWLPSHPPPLLRPPPPGIRTAPPVQDSDLDTSDSDDDDDDESLPAAPVHGRSIPSSAVPISRKCLSGLLQNALVSRPSASPFVLSPPSRNPQNLSYPRSTNRGPLSRQETLHSLMLKKHLLHRLHDPSDPLSSSEQASILPFSVKCPPSLLPPFAPSIDEIALPKSTKVLEHSPDSAAGLTVPASSIAFQSGFPPVTASLAKR
ncbi:hypothetical protein BDZ89DRAFT_19883 [Hymenopellis radicata]|nr:hypothetical protein BDZ89DRAFT_19883 [Hymenopellis radicata]